MFSKTAFDQQVFEPLRRGCQGISFFLFRIELLFEFLRLFVRGVSLFSFVLPLVRIVFARQGIAFFIELLPLLLETFFLLAELFDLLIEFGHLVGGVELLSKLGEFARVAIAPVAQKVAQTGRVDPARSGLALVGNEAGIEQQLEAFLFFRRLSYQLPSIGPGP